MHFKINTENNKGINCRLFFFIHFLHLFLQVWSSIGFNPKQLQCHSRHIFINTCIHWESVNISGHQWTSVESEAQELNEWLTKWCFLFASLWIIIHKYDNQSFPHQYDHKHVWHRSHRRRWTSVTSCLLRLTDVWVKVLEVWGLLPR